MFLLTVCCPIIFIFWSGFRKPRTRNHICRFLICLTVIHRQSIALIIVPALFLKDRSKENWLIMSRIFINLYAISIWIQIIIKWVIRKPIDGLLFKDIYQPHIQRFDEMTYWDGLAVESVIFRLMRNLRIVQTCLVISSSKNIIYISKRWCQNKPCQGFEPWQGWWVQTCEGCGMAKTAFGGWERTSQGRGRAAGGPPCGRSDGMARRRGKVVDDENVEFLILIKCLEFNS